MEALDYLDKIGRAREAVKTESANPLHQIMKVWSEQRIAEMKAGVQKASGTLAASIGFKFGATSGVLTIDFLADDYWDYLNSGVDGVRTNAGAIPNKFGSTYSFKSEVPSRSMVDSFMGKGKQNWLATKGITSLTYGNNTYQLSTDAEYRAAAYVFARAVKRKGIKPSNFVGNSITEDSIKFLENLLLDAMVNLF